MSAKHLWFCSFVLMLASCTGTSERKRPEHLPRRAAIVEVKTKITDTIRSANHTYYIQSISKREYTKLKASPDLDMEEEFSVSKEDSNWLQKTEALSISRTWKKTGDSTLLVRKGNTLELKLVNRTTTLLVNQSCENGECINYYFSRYIPDLKLFVIDVSYYEGSDVLIVNAYDGKQFYISGDPVVSPDRKKIMAASLDLYAGFDFNGIVVLTIENNELTEDLRHETSFGPGKPEWIDNNNVKMEQTIVIPGKDGAMKEEKKYCQITIE